MDRPLVIGFTVYESFAEGPNSSRLLKLPESDERVLGGWTMLVVGYETQGWIVRNFQEPSWGTNGHAIMPYGYETTWFDAWTAQS